MTFSDLIDKWPSQQVLATDLNTSQQAISNMKARNSIPVWRWDALVESAKKCGIKGVTFKSLSRMKAQSILERKKEDD